MYKHKGEYFYRAELPPKVSFMDVFGVAVVVALFAIILTCATNL